MWALSLVLVSLLFLGPQSALAQSRPKPATAGDGPRVALVIGNNDYHHVQKLNNAVQDAKAMAVVFRELGFDVIEKINVDQRNMKAAVREFVKRIGSGGVGAFFYAGHGVQEGGNNYLLPVDIGKLSDPGALPDEAVELNDDVMGRIGQAGAKFSLLVIDACRDNPFPKRAGRSVGGTRGLTAAAETPEGMVVVYSAGVGQQALDRLDEKDRNPNGLFTREFIAELRKPGLEVAEMVRNVRQRVKEAAATVQHEQTPAIYIQADRFYLVAPPAAPLPTPPVLPSSEDALWAQLDSDKPCEYLAYLEEYPKGKFAALARIRAKDCVPASRQAPKETVAMVKPPTKQEEPLSLPAAPAPKPAEAKREPERASVAASTEPLVAKAAVVEPAKPAPVAETPAPQPAKPEMPVLAGPPLAATAPPKGKTSTAAAKEKPAPKSSPFSMVPSPPVAKPKPASADTVPASAFLELPMPAEMKAAASGSTKARPEPAKTVEERPALAPQLEIATPKADPGMQLAMLAPTKDALPRIRQKGEPGDQPDLLIGDSWTMQRLDLFTKIVTGSWSDRVQAREGSRVTLESTSAIGRSMTTGLLALDPASWHVDSARIVEGRPQPLAFPLSVGKTWEYTYRRKRNDDQGTTLYRVKAKVVSFEKVETPAGSFDAFKVVHQKNYETSRGSENWSSSAEEIYWYAPAARRWVRHDLIDRSRSGRIADQYREELVRLDLRP